MINSSLNNAGFHSEVIRFIGKKWVVPIFLELEKNKQARFVDLKRLGVTSKILTEILEEMKNMKFIKKNIKNSFPPSTIYTLSNRGKDLLEYIKKFDDFSKEHNLFQYAGNINNHKQLRKFLILLTIEKSILKIDHVQFKRIEDLLLSDFNYTLKDCIDNPSPLKKVLYKLCEKNSEKIIQTIKQSLNKSDDKYTKQFLELIKS